MTRGSFRLILCTKLYRCSICLSAGGESDWWGGATYRTPGCWAVSYWGGAVLPPAWFSRCSCRAPIKRAHACWSGHGHIYWGFRWKTLLGRRLDRNTLLSLAPLHLYSTTHHFICSSHCRSTYAVVDFWTRYFTNLCIYNFSLKLKVDAAPSFTQQIITSFSVHIVLLFIETLYTSYHIVNLSLCILDGLFRLYITFLL